MNTFKKALVALTSITLLAGMTACGDADPVQAPASVVTVTAPAEPATPLEEVPMETVEDHDGAGEDLYQIRHFEEDIIAHLGLDSNGYVKIPDSTTECEAVVIMPNLTTVELYADAGDLVATNPNGTAGVKVGSSGGERECFTFFEEALSDFGVEG